MGVFQHHVKCLIKSPLSKSCPDVLEDVWAFPGLGWLSLTLALLSPLAAPAEVGHSCSRGVNDFTRHKPSHQPCSWDTHRDQMLPLKARRTGLKFLPGQFHLHPQGGAHGKHCLGPTIHGKNLSLLALLVLIYFNILRQPWAQEALNAWPRAFSGLLHWERSMGTL